MKKSLIAVAVATAFAGAAQAQSSVTVYGTLDGSIGQATQKKYNGWGDCYNYTKNHCKRRWRSIDKHPWTTWY